MHNRKTYSKGKPSHFGVQIIILFLQELNGKKKEAEEQAATIKRLQDELAQFKAAQPIVVPAFQWEQSV